MQGTACAVGVLRLWDTNRHIVSEALLLSQRDLSRRALVPLLDSHQYAAVHFIMFMNRCWEEQGFHHHRLCDLHEIQVLGANFLLRAAVPFVASRTPYVLYLADVRVVGWGPLTIEPQRTIPCGHDHKIISIENKYSLFVGHSPIRVSSL